MGQGVMFSENRPSSEQCSRSSLTSPRGADERSCAMQVGHTYLVHRTLGEVQT